MQRELYWCTSNPFLSSLFVNSPTPYRYDVTDKNSFDHVESLWLDRIAHYAPTKAQRVLIIGNKTDLPNRVIDTDVGKELAASNYFSFPLLSLCHLPTFNYFSIQESARPSLRQAPCWERT